MEATSATATASALAPFSFLSMFLSGVALALWNAIPWTCIFLLIRWTGVRLYVLNNPEVCRRIRRRVSRTSHIGDEGRGYGYSFGRWYLMEITQDYNEEKVWMIATEASYKALTTDAIDLEVAATAAITTTDMVVPPGSIERWDRTGSFDNIWWKSRKIHGSWTARPDQAEAIETVRTHFVKNKHTVVFLHGLPGSGKSMIPILLAKAIGGKYCNSFAPWQPGDRLYTLYDMQEPTAENPLIISMDEIDGPLLAIHAGIPGHKNIPIAVQNKTGWNTFLDEIQRGLYPHVILVLSSNKGPAFFDELDPSYFREGRVDLKIQIGLKKNE
jgi:hypothetical protein